MTAHNRAHNLASTLRCDEAASRMEQVSVNGINQIALAQRFPVQPVSRIEHDFSGIGRSRCTLSGTKKDFDERLPDGTILRRNDHGGMISKTRIERPDFPGIHKSSMFRLFFAAFRIDRSEVRPAILSRRSACRLG